MTERLRIFAASMFTAIPWLIAAGMAGWMAYQTTDPRAAEIEGNVQTYLIAGLVAFAAIAVVMAWLCLSLNRRTWWPWWAVRITLWLLLALWGTLAVRAFDSPAALMEDPVAFGKDVRLLGLAVLIVINIAFIVMIERSRALFNSALRLS